MRKALVVAAAVGLVGLGWLARTEADDRALGPDVAWSMIALGDTGKIPHVVAYTSPQLAVARAISRRHGSGPVDALALLGDNFYPTGLKERKFKERLRVNLATPYCGFLALTDRGEGSLGDACPVSPEQRAPVPILAVLGNHDYGERESPALQRERIPEYISNWRMPLEAGVHEADGVSIISFQSEEVKGGADISPLKEAIEHSRGPWRIIIAHHPVVDPGQGYVASYTRRVNTAIWDAGQPVHVFLAGHEHNLQALRGQGASLHVVSGSGSDVRDLGDTPAERLFGLAALGFVRIDRVARVEEDAEHLLITFFALRNQWLGTAGPVAAFRIDADGSVREVPPAS